MYGTNGRACLNRARERLGARTQASLFYAAFELRTGIEARMHEYLEARNDIAERKKHGYQIAKLGRGLERIFAAGEKIVEIRVFARTDRPLGALYFTPVRASLRKRGERLGDLLHRQPFRPDDDRWWHDQRDFLLQTADELEFATTGELLGPPLINEATNRLSFIAASERDNRLFGALRTVGRSVTIKVAYLDELRAQSRTSQA